MTDIEIITLCAKAINERSVAAMEFLEEGNAGGWNPLKDDSQAILLIKAHNIDISRCDGGDFMVTDNDNPKLGIFFRDENLNRAICECVAYMQKDK